MELDLIRAPKYKDEGDLGEYSREQRSWEVRRAGEERTGARARARKASRVNAQLFPSLWNTVGCRSRKLPLLQGQLARDRMLTLVRE